MEKYRLVKKIGQGSFGEVWLVRGFRTYNQYVLKQLNLQHTSKREQRAAHLEVKLLSTLKHPNIVSYLDSFYNSKGNLFIVMGYCENGDLHTHIRNQNGVPFPEKQIVEWLVQICMALKYLHDKKILHRNLKTKNIFLTRSYQIKVGDIGIDRVLDRKANMASVIMGSSSYVNPEIFCSESYSFKFDVWALGCCMYELSTLKDTFHASSFPSFFQGVLNGEVPGMNEQYSQEFHDIVLSMLNIDSEKRPSVTDILLNSYVRNHIVIFLKETKGSAKLLPARCPQSASRSKENCVLEDTISSCDTSMLCGTPVSKENVSVLDIFDSKVHTSQTPDINGNGDGNDNSQHRYAVKNQLVSRNFDENIQNETSQKPDSNEDIYSLPQLSNSHSNACLKETHTSAKVISNSKIKNVDFTAEMKKSDYVARKSLKSVQRNGQLSLNFLRKLTCTMNNVSGYPLTDMNMKTDYQSTYWNSGSLPAISSGVTGFSGSQQNGTEFGFYNFKSKRFKSSEPFEHRCTNESHSSSADSITNKRHLMDEAEQKENCICPKLSAVYMDYQLTAPRGSKIPIFNVNAQKEGEDPPSNKTSQHHDLAFPDVSRHHPLLLRSNGEDCTYKVNPIDGSLLQKIINCNIEANTVPGHLKSTTQQKWREREKK